MNTSAKNVYTPEFKAKLVAMAMARPTTITKIAADAGIPPASLYNWLTKEGFTPPNSKRNKAKPTDYAAQISRTMHKDCEHRDKSKLQLAGMTLTDVINLFEYEGRPFKEKDGKYLVACPAHATSLLSCILSQDHEGRVMSECFEGCPEDKIEESIITIAKNLNFRAATRTKPIEITDIGVELQSINARLIANNKELVNLNLELEGFRSTHYTLSAMRIDINLIKEAIESIQTQAANNTTEPPKKAIAHLLPDNIVNLCARNNTPCISWQEMQHMVDGDYISFLSKWGLRDLDVLKSAASESRHQEGAHPFTYALLSFLNKILRPFNSLGHMSFAKLLTLPLEEGAPLAINSSTFLYFWRARNDSFAGLSSREYIESQNYEVCKLFPHIIGTILTKNSINTITELHALFDDYTGSIASRDGAPLCLLHEIGYSRAKDIEDILKFYGYHIPS